MRTNDQFKEAAQPDDLRPWFTVPARRPPTDAEFRRFLRGQWSEVLQILEDLRAGRITPREFGERIYEQQVQGHSLSWMLGRQRSGLLHALDQDDYLAGIANADHDGSFLSQFVLDLAEGRYTDEDDQLKVRAVESRLRLYVGRQRGASSESFVRYSDDLAVFDWVLGEVEEHCQDCPDIAAQNPWRGDFLYIFPGDGSTECLANCKCHLLRDDGVTSFAPVLLQLSKS